MNDKQKKSMTEAARLQLNVERTCLIRPDEVCLSRIPHRPAASAGAR